MGTKKIIVDIPFNIDFRNYFSTNDESWASTQRIFDKYFDEVQTKPWIDYRIGIFMSYTGKCFINQTNQNFLCLIRYSDETKGLIFDALAKYPQLQSNIMFTTNNEADAIIENAINENDLLYHVNIDSDNMYESHFIEQVDNYVYEEGVECLLCHDGYIYDKPTNRLAEISHFSPSYYTYIYNKETYKKYFRERLFEPHANAITHRHVSMGGRTYLFLTHENNLDNEFELIKDWLGDGTTIEGDEKERILSYWKII
ncbi:MAG: hypothetical protein ACRDA5_09385 [Clostridium sp.]